MKLEESDIRAVATGRFWSRSRFLKLIGALFGTLVVGLIIVSITASNWSTLVFIPVFVYMCLEMRNATRYQKELVAQWKAEQK